MAPNKSDRHAGRDFYGAVRSKTARVAGKTSVKHFPVRALHKEGQLAIKERNNGLVEAIPQEAESGNGE
jgi:hypothetical protein